MEIQANSTQLEELLVHASWVRGLARTLVGEGPEAEDVVQETWLAALRNAPAGVRSPRAWLSQVVRNVVRQRRRSEDRRQSREERVEPQREAQATPEELARRVETERQVAAAVLRLPEPLRQTLLLRYFEGLNSPGIAERMEVSPNTVRWRLSRGLKLLKEQLDGEFGDRRTWSILLAPLAASPSPLEALELPVGESARLASSKVPTLASSAIGGASALKGGLALTLAPKLVVPAALLLGAVAFHFLSEEPPTPPEARLAVDVQTEPSQALDSGAGTNPAAVQAERTTERIAREVNVGSPVEGFGRLDLLLINRATGEPIPECSVEVAKASAVGMDPPPRSRSLPQTATGVGEAPCGDLLTDPDQRTDETGRVRLHLEMGQPLQLTCGRKGSLVPALRDSVATGLEFGLEPETRAYEPAAQRIAPLQNGEVRTLRIELDPLEFWGMARDRATGEILRAVGISRTLGGETAPEGGGDVLRHHAAGSFSFHAPGSGPRARWIQVPGYASVPFVPNPKLGTETKPRVFELDRAGTLRVQVQRHSDALPRAVVRLAREASLMSGDRFEFLQVDLNQTTDERGECTFDQLEVGQSYRVTVQPEGSARAQAFEPITLQPGESRSEVYSLGAMTRLSGRLLDDRGTAIADHGVWLRKQSKGEESLEDHAYFSALDSCWARARTDAQGWFHFDEVPAGDWRVGPAPSPQGNSKSTAHQPPIVELPPLAQRVQVSGAVPVQEIELRVPRGLSIEGRVVSFDGSPASGAWVSTWSPELAGTSIPARTDEDGRFRLGPLMDREHRLFVDPGVRSDLARAPESSMHRPDGSEVVFRLLPGCGLACELLGVDPRVSRRLSVSIFEDGGGGARSTGRSDNEVHYSWTGLSPGSWSVLASDSLGNVWFSGSNALTPEGGLASLRLESARGGTLEVFNSADQGALLLDVFLGAARLGHRRIRQGRRSIFHLPPGEFTVRCSNHAGESRKKRVRVVAGEASDLNLTPDLLPPIPR